MRTIKVGTRESKLALIQTNLVIDKIKEKHTDISFEVIKVKTKGDIFLDKRLDEIGGKGLFVSELEKLILSGDIDFAVHSLKDMPSELDEGLIIGAVSEREDPRDVLVTRNFESLKDLKYGAIIGTSSVRREIEIRSRRSDLQVKSVRGNIHTRLSKLENGEYDGLILAAAGLRRLNLFDERYDVFQVDNWVPAVGQGIMCIETKSDGDISYLLDSIHSNESQLMVLAERTFLRLMNGGCSVPITAHAYIENEEMTLYGMNGIGEIIKRKQVVGHKSKAVELAIQLAKELR